VPTTEPSPNATTSARWVLAAAGLVALVVGTVHIAVLTIRLAWWNTLIWHSREYPWMVPTAYLLTFLALAAPIVVLRRFLRAVWIARLFVFVGALSILFLFPRLAPWSQVVLAVGVGVSLGTVVGHQPTRRIARSWIVLGLAVGVTAIGDVLARRIRRTRATASLSAPPTDAPNVLLIILDTVRAASLGLYGYERPTTPALTRWAAEGVVFDRAISPSSWTLPSHGSLFTGREAAELPTTWRVPLDAQFPTLAEVLRDRGYATAGFVANTYYAGHDSGLGRGFGHYGDYRTSLAQLSWSTTLAQTNLARDLRWSRSLGDVAGALRRFDLSLPVLLNADRKLASQVTEDFLGWQSRAAGRPFFAFLNYFDAHVAYYAPPRYRQLLGVGRSDRDRYDAAIRYLDDEIDRVLSTLRVRGVLDRTIVVITADHGEQFGEHGLTGHGNSLYLPVVHVPLVMRYPARVPAGRRVADPVSLRDVPATILGLAGFAGVPGRSLLDSLGSPAESFLTHYGDGWLPRDRQRTMRSAVLGDLHWIRAFDGSESVFDYQRDPAEVTNLIADSSVVARLRAVRR
jgi:arylsulfatase A-like enzyme